jgi:hypothetical protein
MTDHPHENASSSVQNHSDHFPDTDTRLEGSDMQVLSAPISGAGEWTMEDYLRWGNVK